MTNASPHLVAHKIVPLGLLRPRSIPSKWQIGDFSFMDSSAAQTIKPTTDVPLCANYCVKLWNLSIILEAIIKCYTWFLVLLSLRVLSWVPSFRGNFRFTATILYSLSIGRVQYFGSGEVLIPWCSWRAQWGDNHETTNASNLCARRSRLGLLLTQ